MTVISQPVALPAQNVAVAYIINGLLHALKTAVAPATVDTGLVDVITLTGEYVDERGVIEVKMRYTAANGEAEVSVDVNQGGSVTSITDQFREYLLGQYRSVVAGDTVVIREFMLI